MSDEHIGSAPDLVGRVIGNYTIEKEIGSGGMGRIFRGRHLRLPDMIVAIKVLHHHLLDDPTNVGRFMSEARVVSKLKSRHTVSVIDFGNLPEGLMYIVMEFVEGVSLSEYLELNFPLSSSECVAILSQVCCALEEAHSHSIIHRDLKPENIMVSRGRDNELVIKVLDFGIAKLQDTDATPPTTTRGFRTRTGFVCGTPEYMSPEQITAKAVDSRSDLYSLGIILYEMLTHKKPFTGANAIMIGMQHIGKEPTAIKTENQNADSHLAKLAHSLLQKDPDDRPASAKALLTLLHSFEGHVPSPVASTPHAAKLPTPIPLPRDTLGETRIMISEEFKPRKSRVKYYVIAVALMLVALLIVVTIPSLHSTPDEIPTPEFTIKNMPNVPLPSRRNETPAQKIIPVEHSKIETRQWHSNETGYARRPLEETAGAYGAIPVIIPHEPKPVSLTAQEIARLKRELTDAQQNASWNIVVMAAKQLSRLTHDPRYLKEIGRAQVHLGATTDACRSFKLYASKVVKNKNLHDAALHYLEQNHCP